MLTIFALTDAKQAAQYYESDNYYAKGSVEAIAATHWWGKGAQALGLVDYVEPERFIELLAGRIEKNTLLERVRHDGGVSHKPGYDLTFSAPKSVSMLAEIGHDERIYHAHDKAINVALTYLESRVAHYRHTVDGATQVKKADNLIVAKFRHDTSRSVDDTIDCQLHTHCVVINAVKSQHGQWRSLHEKAIFDFKMTGGMIYRAALAKELKALGYEIEKTRDDGLFEIKGFQRREIEIFSKRRIKILEVMREQGLFGTHAAQEVTLNTRESKISIDHQKLDQHWAERAKVAGLDFAKIINTSKRRLRLGIVNRIDNEKNAAKALQYALDHLGERQSVFQEKDIIRTALQYGLGSLVIDDIHQAIADFKEQGLLHYLGSHQHRDIYSTPKILEREQQIIQAMREGKNEYDPIASHEVVALYLQEELIARAPEGLKPTQCQLKAVDFLAQSTDQVVGVQGYAGTGKTTMLRAICRLAEAGGYTIRGAAPSASAADVLRTDTAIATDTLTTLLIELAKEQPQPTIARPEIIVLDEASMASTRQMFDLLHQAKRLNKRVFLVGDKLQLPAVEAGSPFTLLQNEGMATTYLTEIVRQKAPDLKFAVKETIHGDVSYALQAVGNKAFFPEKADGEAFYSKHSQVAVIKGKKERLETIAKHYLRLTPEDRNDTIVLLGSNEDRQNVNTQIRLGLKEQGVISHREISTLVLQSRGLTQVEKHHVHNYAIGDIVKFNKPYRSLGVKRFDYLTVVGIDVAANELMLKGGGRKVAWNPQGVSTQKGDVIEIFEQSERHLAAGDYIRWTHNRKNLDIYNTETAKVLSILGNTANVKLKNGKIIPLNLAESINMHWDYAWSSTVYAAQGKKARNVIAQLEGYNPHLSNFRAFYVTLSRAVDQIHLYVDDLEKATRTIQEHTGEKSNASEFLTTFKERQAVEQYIQEAYLKLDGNIHELNTVTERLTELAKQYVKLAQNSKVHLIATDFKDRTQLNALIRNELKAVNVLDTQEISASSLRSYHIRSHDTNMALLPGMIVGFTRSYAKQGVQKGQYYTVASIDALGDKAILCDANGAKSTVDIAFLVARQTKDVMVYKLDDLPLTVGDSILWTKDDKPQGIIAGKLARVIDINTQQATLAVTPNQHITLSLNDPRMMHWQYAYAKSMTDPIPKRYDYALAHLDERTKAPARIAAIFGAMGKASKGAHLYTHHTGYVVAQLKAIAKQDINLHTYQAQAVQKNFHQLLEQFNASKKIVSNAWVSYFERKKEGLDTVEVLQNARILGRAQAELAGQIVADEDFNRAHLKALGFDVVKLERQADQHKQTILLEQYQQAQGVLKGHYAVTIAASMDHLDQELKHHAIDRKVVLTQAFLHQKQLAKLRQSPEQRRAVKTVDKYFDYSREARVVWAKIFKSKDRGLKPEVAKFTYASHLSNLRNQLAYEITQHPEKYADQLKVLRAKTNKALETHAAQFKKQLQKKAEREFVTKSQDWRELLAMDQRGQALNPPIQPHYTKTQKVFWDKDLVLKEAMPKAEAIISSLINEEKNPRKSRGDKIVWGKKNGSVHLHISGAKEGVVNDYERNIHGDLITFYAKSRGLGWYDALSELAAEVGINPQRGSIQPSKSSPEADQKKQHAIKQEQKRRANSLKLAQKTWDESLPIKGTLVETYLKKHRGATFDVNKLDVRFNPKAPLYGFDDNNNLKVFGTKPAMVVRFDNEAKELNAVQCTYLDPETANKDKTAHVVKNTIGSQWGSAGNIYHGGDEKIIIAEGAETAMSLVEAEPNASIYITGGNMQNVQHYDYLALRHSKSEIYIAADNDLSHEAGSWKATEEGARKLAEQGIKPLIAQPSLIKGQKTDFNDVYKRYGQLEVKRQLEPKFTIEITHNVEPNIVLKSIGSASKVEVSSVEPGDYRLPIFEPQPALSSIHKGNKIRVLGEEI